MNHLPVTATNIVSALGVGAAFVCVFVWLPYILFQLHRNQEGEEMSNQDVLRRKIQSFKSHPMIYPELDDPGSTVQDEMIQLFVDMPLALEQHANQLLDETTRLMKALAWQS